MIILLRTLAKPFVILVEEYYPDPFVFATLLTGVGFGMALLLTDATLLESLRAWGNGFSGLMTFIAQISFTLIAGHALAHTRPFQQLFKRLTKIPRKAWQAYALTTFLAAVASLLSWAFGLIVAALVAREVAHGCRKRGVKVHYPLLVAAGYSGFMIWHMGYSGSAQLFVATPGHAYESMVGGVIPVTETLFATYNVVAALFIAFTLPFFMTLMAPRRDEKIVELPPDAETGEDPDSTVHQEEDDDSLGRWLDRQRWITVGIGGALAVYLGLYFAENGPQLTLNIVNWTFLALGLLLADSPIHYVTLVSNASGTVGQIILQYPFYAGLMGLMIDTGLAEIIADWFISFSSRSTLAFWAFISGGLLNVFIPSGGGQWSVQGSIFIQAAQEMNVEISSIVNGIAYGDQWTNMIQPFWTIPMLAIADLEVRDLMGYTFVTLMYGFFVLGGTLLLFAN